MKREPISPYFAIRGDAEHHEYIDFYLEGSALLRRVPSNKGTAFTEDERVALGCGMVCYPPKSIRWSSRPNGSTAAFFRESDPSPGDPRSRLWKPRYLAIVRGDHTAMIRSSRLSERRLKVAERITFALLPHHWTETPNPDRSNWLRVRGGIILLS